MLRLPKSVFSNCVSITCRWYKLQSTFSKFLHAKLRHACNHCVVYIIFIHEILQGCQFSRATASKPEDFLEVVELQATFPLARLERELVVLLAKDD